MTTTALEPCEHCGGMLRRRLWYREPTGHTRRDCPGKPPPYVPKGITFQDRLATLEHMADALELDAAEHRLDGPSRRAWPWDVDFTAECTIREQFELLHYRALRLVGHGAEGRALLDRLTTILDPGSQGFTAPMVVQPSEPPVVPPKAVQLALDRLLLVRAPGDVLLSKEPPQDPDLARDHRLISWWLSTLEEQP